MILSKKKKLKKKEVPTQDPNNSFEPAVKKGYSLFIPPNLFQRIDKHISYLKHQDNHSQSKQRWIVEAIKEKLKKENKQPPREILKEKKVSLRLDIHLHRKLEKHLLDFKKGDGKISKKQWLVEAVEELLEKENSK